MSEGDTGTTGAPLIGLTTYHRNGDHKFDLPAEYVDAVRRAGGIPVLVPPGESRWDDVLRRLDAVILTGGGDISPDAYGGRDHPMLYMVDDERDASEISLARRAVDSGLPTLGICRGTQVLNVALGGTLVEHLPDVVGEDAAARPDQSCRDRRTGFSIGRSRRRGALRVRLLASSGPQGRCPRPEGGGARSGRHDRGGGASGPSVARCGPMAPRADGRKRPDSAAAVRGLGRGGGGVARAALNQPRFACTDVLANSRLT